MSAIAFSFVFLASSFAILAGPVLPVNPPLSQGFPVSASTLPPGSDFTTYLSNIQRTSASTEHILNLTNAPSIGVLWDFYAGKGGVLSAGRTERDFLLWK